MWKARCGRLVWWTVMVLGCQTAVLPPPWADVRSNPCAALPRGWLMLYWPQDGKCYTIYKKGHPCPETMELSPGGAGGGGRPVAECRCPPGWAQLPLSSVCHQLFTQGPCHKGQYFAPVEQSFNKKGERSGMCVKPKRCADESQVFWPRDGRCYTRHGRGPCYSGTILDTDRDGLAQCACEVGGPHWTVVSGEAGAARADGGGEGGCYEHYTRGPCDKSQLFLPGAVCGCHQYLPHFHNQTGGCYQIDTTGPCPRGHTFSITSVSHAGVPRASCVCKPFHELWSEDGACYRLYTRGPCAPDEMIARGGRCVRVPCARGRLYFPRHKKCYRPGSSEPCPDGEVVTFDFDARPSIDGVSHNGKCACGSGGISARACAHPALDERKCSARPGMAVAQGGCHVLYTRGPCAEGAWLVPGAGAAGEGTAGASCVCRPGREGPACRPAVARSADHLNNSL